MFSDSFKMKLVDEVVYEVYGKLIQRKHGDIALDGANPSAEEAADEGTDDAVESGVDVALNSRLVETFAFGDKKSFTAYLKDYMKKWVFGFQLKSNVFLWKDTTFQNCLFNLFSRLIAKLEEKSPDQVEVLKTNINKYMKELLGRFNDLQFFTGESMDVDGMVAICEYRDLDGVSTPVLSFFKHGLDEEKF